MQIERSKQEEEDDNNEKKNRTIESRLLLAFYTYFCFEISPLSLLWEATVDLCPTPMPSFEFAVEI